MFEFVCVYTLHFIGFSNAFLSWNKHACRILSFTGSLDGLFETDNDNSDLGMRTVVGLVIGTILMLAFITYYCSKRHEGELQPGDCLGQNNGDEHRHLLQQEQGGDPVGGGMGPGGGNLGDAVIGNDGPGAHREDRAHYEARRRQNVDWWLQYTDKDTGYFRRCHLVEATRAPFQ